MSFSPATLLHPARPRWVTLANLLAEPISDSGTFSLFRVPETQPFDDQKALPLVLIVDEDDLARGLVAHRLDAAGFPVETAKDAGQAAAILKLFDVGVVVLSLSLLGRTGIDLILDVRADPKMHATPVLAVRKLGNDRDIERAFEAGADDLVCSPIVPAEIVARVRALARPRSRALRLVPTHRAA